MYLQFKELRFLEKKANYLLQSQDCKYKSMIICNNRTFHETKKWYAEQLW